MKIYPKLYLNNVTEITLELLEKHKIKGLILDIDNTLMDYNHNLVKGLEEWIAELKQANIKLFIVSNTNHEEKAKKIGNLLNIPYIYFAKKPFKSGLNKAKEQMNLEANQIAVVGDQIFTDVLGANRCKMFSILVKPLDEKDIWITKLKRPIENKIIKNYLKSINKKQ